MLERLEQLMEDNQSFSFETTLSGLSYLNFITKAKEKDMELLSFLFT
jgi:predicted ABC-type ATPase